jgi:hypothetical protein
MCSNHLSAAFEQDAGQPAVLAGFFGLMIFIQ